jgi:hypothetical protein
MACICGLEPVALAAAGASAKMPASKGKHIVSSQLADLFQRTKETFAGQKCWSIVLPSPCDALAYSPVTRQFAFAYDQTKRS